MFHDAKDKLLAAGSAAGPGGSDEDPGEGILQGARCLQLAEQLCCPLSITCDLVAWQITGHCKQIKISHYKTSEGFAS